MSGIAAVTAVAGVAAFTRVPAMKIRNTASISVVIVPVTAFATITASSAVTAVSKNQSHCSATVGNDCGALYRLTAITTGTTFSAVATIASFIVATNCLDFGSENAIHMLNEFIGVISVAILTANEFVITFSAVSVVDIQCTGHIIDNILDIHSAGTSAPVYLQFS